MVKVEIETMIKLSRPGLASGIVDEFTSRSQEKKIVTHKTETSKQKLGIISTGPLQSISIRHSTVGDVRG
jgi:hypothetical protein